MNKISSSLVAIGMVVGTVIVAASTSGSVAQAEPPSGTLTLVQLNRDAKSHFVDAPPLDRESTGDVFTVAGPLRTADKEIIGKLAAQFTQTSRYAAQGSVTFILDDGSIAVVGALSSGDLSTLTVVGGSGEYAGARGTVEFDSSGRATKFTFDFDA